MERTKRRNVHMKHDTLNGGLSIKMERTKRRNILKGGIPLDFRFRVGNAKNCKTLNG